MHYVERCLFCGGDPHEPGHRDRCDGRQGAVEALGDAHTLARTTDPGTSHEAADAILPMRTVLQQRVFAALAAHGPLTDEALLKVPELQGLGPSTIRTRRSELCVLGWVRAEGQTTNPRGRHVIIWAVSEGAAI